MNVKELLNEKGYSVVASNGYTSFEHGIKPLLKALNEDLHFFEGLSVADKIIGKASAMLLSLSGAREVYTPTLSKAGKEVFDRYGVICEYDELADMIWNMAGDDMCPMEKTVRDIDDLNEAYEALKKKVAPL